MVGCCNDETTHKYKGKTVMTESARYESIRHCNFISIWIVEKIPSPSPEAVVYLFLLPAVTVSPPFSRTAAQELGDIFPQALRSFPCTESEVQSREGSIFPARFCVSCCSELSCIFQLVFHEFPADEKYSGELPQLHHLETTIARLSFDFVVILVPTRELALHTSQVCKKLGKHLEFK